MNDTTQSTDGPAVRTDGGMEDERTLRQRVRENPRPAALWFAGLLPLVAVELPRFVDWFLTLIGGVIFAFNAFGLVPGWIGGIVENGLGSVVGATVHDIVALMLLFILAVVIRGFLPFHPDEKLGLHLGRSRRIWFERGLVTAILAAVAFLMAYTPIGGFVNNEIGFYAGLLDGFTDTQTLLSRETIPNHGHQTPSGGWDDTFLGLSPRAAYFIRFTLVWVYAAVFMAWLWRGYTVFREHYRKMDWTPRDDIINRLRNHNWGMFGLAVVTGFIVLALFAPVIATYPIQENVYQPYAEGSEFEYYNEEAGEVETALHGQANLESRSQGAGDKNVGINEYDDYGRYAPLGTTTSGEDMMTHLAYGAQTSMTVGLIAVAIAFSLSTLLSMVAAYYKGAVDLLIIQVSDTISAVPALVVVLLLSVVLNDHPVAQVMDGGLMLAVIFGVAFFPGMWRSIRGPSLQVSEEEWVDAAKSYGQTPLGIMRKHMAPFVMSYLIIYASLLIGGMVILGAALSFLGYGISEPTPEWGRLINSGRTVIATQSWHISTVSGLMITLVVTGFNALGDGIRDAIDPEADANAQGGAGGGA